MGIELPSELAGVAAQAGVRWPEADESAMADQAQAWRDAATNMSTVTTDADRTVRGALDSVRGDTGTAATQHWQTFVEPDSGHLTSAVRGMNDAADRLEHASQQVGAAKVEIVRNLVSLAQNSDAAHSAAAAGNPMALAGLDTAIRGTSANVANLESNLINAVQPASGVDMSGVRDPVNANPGTHGPVSTLLSDTTNLADHATGGATDLVANTTQGATDLVADTASGAGDGGRGHGGLPLVDTVRGTTDLVGNTAQGATNLVADTAQGATNDVADTAQGAGGGGHGHGGGPLVDTVRGATDLVGNTAQGATDLVADTAQGAADVTGDGGRGHGHGGPLDPVRGTADVVRDTAHGATNLVGDTAQGATNLVGDTAQGASQVVGAGDHTGPGDHPGPGPSAGHGPGGPVQAIAGSASNVVGGAPGIIGGDPDITGPVPIDPGHDHPTPPTGLTSQAGLAGGGVGVAAANPATNLPPVAPGVGGAPAPGGPNVGGAPGFGGGPAFGGGGPAPGIVGGPAAGAAPGPGAGARPVLPAPGPPAPGAPAPGTGGPRPGGPGPGMSGPGAPGTGVPAGPARPAAPGPGAAAPGGARPAEAFLPEPRKGGYSAAVPPVAPAQPGFPPSPADKERAQALAAFWVHMFPIGHMPVAVDRPARQLPAPPPELDYAPGLRFEPGDHPRSDLVDSTDRRAALREGVPPLEPSEALRADAPEVVALAEGHDPLGGENERDWDRRYLVRFGSVTAHGISRDGVEFAWPPGEQYPEGGSDEAEAEVLEEGTEIDRFGRWEGRVFAAADTPFAQRSLPPAHIEHGYRRYRVLRPVPVWRAVSAAWFAQSGGGVRYRTTHSALELVALGYLADITAEESTKAEKTEETAS